MTEPTRSTTAQYLGAYRKELLEQGFTEEQAFDLVSSAARELIPGSGLCLKEQADV